MNYSIILLGATISLSLFLRICDICEAMEMNSIDSEYAHRAYLYKGISNSDEIVDGWSSGDRMYRLRGKYRTLQSNTPSSKFQNGQNFETVVENWGLDLSANKEFKPNFVWESGSEDEICGTKVRDESHTYNSHKEIIAPGMEPTGCFYTDMEKLELSCNDTTLTEIPPLPSTLNKLDFRQTQIKELHSQDFGNVTIEHIQFFQNHLDKVDTWAFEKVKGLKSINIINNQIEYLAYELYRGLTELEILMLDFNRISFEIYQHCGCRPIEEIPLVLPNLRYFSLSGNPLKMIPPQMWAGLRESRNLTTLVLFSCSLESIDRMALSFLPYLTNLDISDNPELMPNLVEAFEGMEKTSLKILQLKANNLKDPPKDALAMVSNTLTTLYLSLNPIEYLNPSSFSGPMLELTSLYLEDCKLRSIDPGTLELIPNLSILMLKNNQLTQIPPSIQFLSKLKTLFLDNNRNVDSGGRESSFIIPTHTFSNLTSLTTLSLAQLNIGSISNHTFQGLSKLSTLILDDAEIRSIADGAFTDLVELKSLSIKNNPLQPINSLTFYGMTNLQTLLMHNCSLSFPKPANEIKAVESLESTTTSPLISSTTTVPLIPGTGNPSTPFELLPSLRWVELPYNNIEQIYSELFSGAVHLIMVDFTGNQIVAWDSSIFPNNYSYSTGQREIMVAHNKLTKVSDVMLQDILQFQANAVDLSHNPFICDQNACNLRDMLLGEFPINATAQNQKTFLKLNWTDVPNYKCVHSDNNQYDIVNITDALCKSFVGGYVQEPEPEASEADSPKTITIAISVICVTGLIVAAVITGYKKRVHLKYAWFVAKINMGNLPRKAKTSVVEAIQYDYDIFVSYHNTDRDFVQDKFLPEVEDSSEKNESSTDVEDPGSQRFRVCLHERDFEAGVPIAENIIESVDRSRKVVIIVSKKYLESQWCTYEMNLAYHRLIESRRNSFVLLFLEGIPSELRTKVLNYLMRSRTYLEWPGDGASAQEMNRFWSRLTTSLSSVD